MEVSTRRGGHGRVCEKGIVAADRSPEFPFVEERRRVCVCVRALESLREEEVTVGKKM